MSQALALFVLGLQLYIAAITSPLPADVRARAIELSNVATTTAAAMMNAPAPVQVGTGSAGITSNPTQTMNLDIGVSTQASASVSTGTTADQQAQPAAFARTGSVSAVLASQSSVIPLSGGRAVVATIRITNSTNETIRFSQSGNINARVVVSNNTLAPWNPLFVAMFKNADLIDDQKGIAPGESGDVQIVSTNVPDKSGAFDIELASFRVAGLTSGDMIDVSGFPISLGTIEAK